MQIKTKGDLTTISFYSVEQFEKAKFTAFLLLIFPGLILLFLSKFFAFPQSTWNCLFVFYLAAAIGLSFLAYRKKKIEIHPERIFAKNYITQPEIELPIKKGKMALLVENIPTIQFFRPKEKWRILVGYEDEIYYLTGDLSQYRLMREVVRAISQKLDLPVIDYTYSDQADIIMYLKPQDLDAPFTERVLKFPDLLVMGEPPDYKVIYEEIISARKRIYRWTTLTWKNLIFPMIVAGIFALMVMGGIIGVKNSLIDVPFLQDNRNIYILILLIYLMTMTYITGVKKTLILDKDRIIYKHQLFGKNVEKKEIPSACVLEVRIKPSPSGFITLIVSKDCLMELRTHAGGLDDFANLLWLTTKVQDFLLENRASAVGEHTENAGEKSEVENLNSQREDEARKSEEKEQNDLEGTDIDGPSEEQAKSLYTKIGKFVEDTKDGAKSMDFEDSRNNTGGPESTNKLP